MNMASLDLLEGIVLVLGQLRPVAPLQVQAEEIRPKIRQENHQPWNKQQRTWARLVTGLASALGFSVLSFSLFA
jgi:hypothetical protein